MQRPDPEQEVLETARELRRLHREHKQWPNVAEVLGFPEHYKSSLADIAANRTRGFSRERLHEVRQALGLPFLTRHELLLWSDERARVTITPGKGQVVRVRRNNSKPAGPRRVRLDITNLGISQTEARQVLLDYTNQG